jgi:hypothetical protein
LRNNASHEGITTGKKICDILFWSQVHDGINLKFAQGFIIFTLNISESVQYGQRKVNRVTGFDR